MEKGESKVCVGITERVGQDRTWDFCMFVRFFLLCFFF